MACPPPITTTVLVSSMPPVVPMSQLLISTMVLPLGTHPMAQPQACPPALHVKPVALILPVQDVGYELKAAMDAQTALIATLITNKEKDSIEEVK